MAFLNETLPHYGLQKYLDTNTFGFCCFDFWLSSFHSLDMIQKQKISILSFWHIVSVLLLAFSKSLIWFCVVSQFRQLAEDHICATKVANLADVSLVESWQVSLSLNWKPCLVLCLLWMFCFLSLKWPLKHPVNKHPIINYNTCLYECLCLQRASFILENECSYSLVTLNTFSVIVSPVSLLSAIVYIFIYCLIWKTLLK